MRVSDNRENTRELCNFHRHALRVASGHKDFAAGVLPADSADCGTRILFRGSSHCAGIQDNVTGVVPTGRPVYARCQKLLFYGGAVGLRGTATEIFYVKTRHRTILADEHSRRFAAGSSRASRI